MLASQLLIVVFLCNGCQDGCLVALQQIYLAFRHVYVMLKAVGISLCGVCNGTKSTSPGIDSYLLVAPLFNLLLCLYAPTELFVICV